METRVIQTEPVAEWLQWLPHLEHRGAVQRVEAPPAAAASA